MKRSFKLLFLLLIVYSTISTITSLKITTNNAIYTDEKTATTAKVALLSCANKNITNAYFDIRTNKWMEGVLSTKCLQNSVPWVLRFCKRVYPSLNIVNVENIGKQVTFTIEGNCDSNDVACDGKDVKQELNADMYKCIYGKYEDKALFVPPNCEYNEVNESGNKCQTQDYWLFKAGETCKNSDKLLNATSLKKWCVGEQNVGRFEGIQVVCCTSDEDDDIDDDEFEGDNNSDENDNNSQDQINEIQSQNTEQKSPKQQQQQIVKVDLSKNENEVVKQQDQQDDGDDASAIDGDQTELNRYKAEKQRINQEYEDKKTKYVNEWNDQRAKTQDDNKLKSIDDKYNKQLKDIDQDHQRLLDQEDDLHESIVQSSINEKKATAKQNFDNELSKYQSQQTTSTERLLNAFKALFLAEERDRLHQTTSFKRIIDPSSENERVATIIRNLKLIDAQLIKCEVEIRNVAGKQIDMKLSSLIDSIKADYADIRKESDKLIQDYDKPQQQQQQQIVNDNNNNNNNKNDNVDVAKTSDNNNNNDEKTVNDIIYGNNVDEYDDDDDSDESSEEDIDSAEDSVEDTNVPTTKSVVTIKPVTNKKVAVNNDGTFEESESSEDEDEDVDDESNEVSNNNNNNKPSDTNNKPNTNENNKDDDDDDSDGGSDEENSDESSSDEDESQAPVITEDKPGLKGKNPNKVDDSIQHDPLRGDKLKLSTSSIFMYLAMGICGTLFLVLILIGVIVRRRATSRYTQLHTPVDIYSPEEKHVSQMQQHGFVNPTYAALEKQV